MSKPSHGAVTLRAEGMDVHAIYDRKGTVVRRLHDFTTPAVTLCAQSTRAAALASALRADSWRDSSGRLPDDEQRVLVEMLADLTEEIRTLAQLNEQHENCLLAAAKGASHE
ncbi:hypothetical protein [Paraburkholderia caballeronis]|uniref:hypothetical protein n=1 Tax=Paraburkholderia caballeronis TaxID=416943 RepID=UPI0010650036|nr:hypothetical protein [Paraburkholderia caballeronis]TDV16285.1 hypothetical protein C7406_108146 [Paraburkholderia caballeronis]TDV20635.1 hypothetical protein C7408_101146 [Paraburkholderia caballeronis]TDV33103.1 hypothetical protein C7404_101242 [Paraburkholderia caballeronis]